MFSSGVCYQYDYSEKAYIFSWLILISYMLLLLLLNVVSCVKTDFLGLTLQLPTTLYAVLRVSHHFSLNSKNEVLHIFVERNLWQICENMMQLLYELLKLLNHQLHEVDQEEHRRFDRVEICHCSRIHYQQYHPELRDMLGRFHRWRVRFQLNMEIHSGSS